MPINPGLNDKGGNSMRSCIVLGIVLLMCAYSGNREKPAEYIHIGEAPQPVHSEQPISFDQPKDTSQPDTSRGPAIPEVDLGVRVTP